MSSDDTTDDGGVDVEAIQDRLREAGDHAWRLAKEGGRVARDAAQDAAVVAREEWSERTEDVDWRDVAIEYSPLAAKALVGVASLVGVWWLLQAMWGAFGPVATIFYVILFIMGAVGTPLLVTLFAPSFPGIFKDLFGKLNWFLGALTFGNTVLVQLEDGWDLCPAENGEVWIDGEWRDIEGGFEHKSTILGMPFAIAPDKTSPGAYSSVRVDAHADTVSDERIVEPAVTGRRQRGSYRETTPDAGVSGQDGVWLVDLVRVMSQGLDRAGDGGLVEQAEMDTLQEEAKRDRLDGWKPVIGMIVGLILGTGTGFAMITFM